MIGQGIDRKMVHKVAKGFFEFLMFLLRLYMRENESVGEGVDLVVIGVEQCLVQGCRTRLCGDTL